MGSGKGHFRWTLVFEKNGRCRGGRGRSGGQRGLMAEEPREVSWGQAWGIWPVREGGQGAGQNGARQRQVLCRAGQARRPAGASIPYSHD